MIRHGAPEEIRYRQKPHVGTDLLRGVVKSIREEIIRLGGQVLFETKMERVVLRQGRVQAVKSSAGEIPTQSWCWQSVTVRGTPSNNCVPTVYFWSRSHFRWVCASSSGNR